MDPVRLRRRGNQVFTLLIGLTFLAAAWASLDWPFTAKLFPLAISVPALLLVMVEGVRSARKEPDSPAQDHSPAVEGAGRVIRTVGWIFSFLFAAVLVGIPAGCILGVAAYLRFEARESWWVAGTMAAGTGAFFFALIRLLNIPFPAGLLFQ